MKEADNLKRLLDALENGVTDLGLLFVKTEYADTKLNYDG
jgi:hypothetical protein